jgi:hypothetical protein
MTIAAHFPACGMAPSNPGSPPLPEALPTSGIPHDLHPGSFGELVSLYQRNEILLRELDLVNARLGEARAYIASPACVPRLGVAYLQQLRARRKAALLLLGSNDIAARQLLARLSRESLSR